MLGKKRVEGESHYSQFDKVSRECQTHLETLYTKWGNNDEIGFEDDKCAWNRRQLVDKGKNVSEADPLQINNAEGTAQISNNCYKNNGKNLYTADVFTNKGAPMRP